VIIAGDNDAASRVLSANTASHGDYVWIGDAVGLGVVRVY